MELINAQDFRAGMARLAGAVTIVATNGSYGKGGITATAVSSVSDAPPTLLVCVNSSNGLNPLIKANEYFSVNLLQASHEGLSNRFAGMVKGISMEERFLEGDWHASALSGVPMLADSLASFECRLSGFQEIGSHTVMFGEVLSVAISDAAAPLLYFNRSYRTLGGA